MSDIKELTEKILEFRNARNWKQFHTPKDMAISLSLEASELLEHFQWKSAEETTEHIESERQEISHELADILYWTLLMAHDFEIDLCAAFEEKMEINSGKYPVDKSIDSATKYTEL